MKEIVKLPDGTYRYGCLRMSEEDLNTIHKAFNNAVSKEKLIKIYKMIMEDDKKVDKDDEE